MIVGQDVESSFNLIRTLEESIKHFESIKIFEPAAPKKKNAQPDPNHQLIFQEFQRAKTQVREWDSVMKKLQQRANSANDTNQMYFSVKLSDLNDEKQDVQQMLSQNKFKALDDAALRSLEEMGLKVMSQNEIARMEEDEKRQIEKIYQDTLMISDLYKELGLMIESQQEQLDMIQKNIEETMTVAKQAHRNVQAASKLKTIAAMIGITIVGIVSGALVFGTAGLAAGIALG